MSIHQYIGARYVPIFYQNSLDPDSTEWEGNVTYEPMTWVSLSNGNMYLSKKTVPANIGTPASNPAYWMEAGQFNAYINLLQSEIDTINNTDLPAITSDISDLQSNERKRTAIYLGNSYTEGSGVPNSGVYNLTKHMFNDTRVQYAGGCGFVTYTGHNYNFETLLDTILLDSTLDRDSVTDIIILSAWGDTMAKIEHGVSTYESMLQSALASLMTKIKNNFTNPHLRISVALLDIKSYRNAGSVHLKNHFEIHRIFEDNITAYGFEYLGWVGWNAMMNTAYTRNDDHYHPNALGYEVISNNFMSAYEGSMQYKLLSQMVSFSAPFYQDGIQNARITLHPEYCRVNLTSLSYSAHTSPAQYTTNKLVTLGATGTDTDLCCINTFDKTIGLGIMRMYAEPSVILDYYSTIKNDSNFNTYIEGISYLPSVALTARNNGSYIGGKEFVIPNTRA